MADQQDCSQFNSFDPRYYVCLAQNLASGVTTALDPSTLGKAMVGVITGLATAPLKALGLNSLRDGMWRALLVMLGLMAIGMGLLLFAGVAIKEEAGSQTGQAVQADAKTAAMAAAA